MSNPSGGEESLKASVAAFARVAYSDLATVVLVSLSVTVVSVPVVSLGAAVLAATETMTAVVTGEGRGGPIHERDRLTLFVDSFRDNLRRGLPFTAVLLAVVGTATAYARIASVTRIGTFYLGALAGVYAVVIAVAWCFRAASVIVRAPDDPPGFLAAMRDGAYLFLDAPAYAALHVLAAGVVTFAAIWSNVGVAVLLPGLLALLEVVSFEEVAGDGATAIVLAYRGELQ